ncbi:ead/Ea22-like family protein [Pseudomonas aeruginosa]|nr:ead/Ea22-like family protein [Pseudomonas aeruginosa]
MALEFSANWRASTTDHAELRRLSEVATPGEWRTGDGDDSLPDCVLSGEFVVCEHAGGDVDYIAAANPKTVLALLDENDRLKAENEVLRGALQAVVDDPTWRSNDNTLWPKIIKAMNPQGATSSP